MIQASGIKKSYGHKVLLEDATFSLSKGERVGLVGRNGSGKSTLFKILLKKEDSDDGAISMPSGYKLGHLEQHISFSQNNLLEECTQYLPPGREHDSYLAEKILFGLGFNQEDLCKNPKVFSGGYQLRINLTKCLLQEPDLLLLDEPTNYLDILSLQWMKKFLNNFPGEVIIITHDRDFMDSVTTHTMGLHRKRLRKIEGSTDKYYTQLQIDEEIYEKTRVNQERKIENMQRFVERFRAKANKATQAQSVAKKIEKMSILQQLDSEQIMGFRFNYSETPAKRQLEVNNLTFGFDKTPLFSNLSFEVKSTDRIAIIGKNGKGKTTLLNVLASKYPPLEGGFNFHPTTKIGYYQQTHKKDLLPSATVEEEISSANIELGTSEIRGICGAMMFSGDDAKKRISVLSGGEQSRVLLGKVLAQPSNILMLDEPTNHLDMEAIEVLTEEIDAFPGAVLVVTHNEALLKRVATKLIVFRQSGCEVYNGSYQEFLEEFGWEESPSRSQQKNKTERKDTKRQRAELIQKRSRELSPLKCEMEDLEKLIEETDIRLKILQDEVMIEIENPSGKNQIQETYKSIGQLQLKQEAHYDKLDKLLKLYEEISLEYEKSLEGL